MGRVAGVPNKSKTYWVTHLDNYGDFIKGDPTIEVTCCKKTDLRAIIFDYWKVGKIVKEVNPEIKTKKEAISLIEVDNDGFINGRYLITAYLDETGDFDMYWVAEDVEKVSKTQKLLATPGDIKKVS